ncbi:MAG TPA: c-type cytochrome [Marinagarivorans sp.]|nr:c-type cytochrome [Marinagarivorans sp.]
MATSPSNPSTNSSSSSTSSSSTSSSSTSSSSSSSSSTSSSSSSSSSSGGDALVGKNIFEASCASCHGDLGQGGTSTGLNPHLYTQADLTRIIPSIDMNHSSCTLANNCAANTAAYLISLNEIINTGENLYKTLGNGACLNCHGDKGLGGLDIGICSYAHGEDCPNEFVLSYDEVMASVMRMSLRGGSGTPKLCTQTIPSSGCAANVALYLKSLGWKRIRQ